MATGHFSQWTNMRVLFVSDVYFPRVNGVSTSIRTFRQDLASCGVETLLVTPLYDSGALSDEPGVLRVPATPVPRDPEDRRMHWGALMGTLRGLLPRDIDVVHIHTPFMAHYAATRFAKRANIPCIATYHTFFEEYLHHYVPVLPRRIGRFLARSFTRSQCDDVQALIAPSEPMRDVLLEYGVSTPASPERDSDCRPTVLRYTFQQTTVWRWHGGEASVDRRRLQVRAPVPGAHPREVRDRCR